MAGSGTAAVLLSVAPGAGAGSLLTRSASDSHENFAIISMLNSSDIIFVDC